MQHVVADVRDAGKALTVLAFEVALLLAGITLALHDRQVVLKPATFLFIVYPDSQIRPPGPSTDACMIASAWLLLPLLHQLSSMHPPSAFISFSYSCHTHPFAPFEPHAQPTVCSPATNVLHLPNLPDLFWFANFFYFRTATGHCVPHNDCSTSPPPRTMAVGVSLLLMIRLYGPSEGFFTLPKYILSVFGSNLEVQTSNIVLYSTISYYFVSYFFFILYWENTIFCAK